MKRMGKGKMVLIGAIFNRNEVFAADQKLISQLRELLRLFHLEIGQENEIAENREENTRNKKCQY